MANETLNVLLVISKMGKGGAQRIILGLANGLVAHGINVDLLVFYRTPQDITLLAELDPRVKLLNIVNIGLESDHQIQFRKFIPVILLPFMAFWWAVTGKIDKYHIVHGNLLLASIFSGFAATFTRILGSRTKYIETFHADLIALAKWEQHIYSFLWKGKDALVTELRRKDYEILQNKFNRIKVAYIPFGINPLSLPEPDEIIQYQKQYSISADMPVILSITRLNNAEKKIFDLVKTVYKFQKIYTGKFVYLMVGDGPDQKQTRELAKSLGLSDAIRFTGYTDNINIPCALAKVFLITGIEDLVGIAGLQAASLGIPIVSYQIDPTWENTTSLFYNSSSLDELALEMKQLLDNRIYHKKASVHVLSTVRSVFSVDRMILSYIDLYVDLVSGDHFSLKKDLATIKQI